MTVASKIKHGLLLMLVPALVIVAGGWFYLQGGRFVTTNNAYVKSDIISISSEVSGRVMEVIPGNNSRVAQDQLLFRIDDRAYLIARSQAEANLANVRADLESLKAEYQNKVLEVELADTELEFREKERVRLLRLRDQDSISAAQYDQAEFDWKSSQNEVETKKQALQVVRARLIDPDQPVENHPRYGQSMADLARVKLDLSHVEVIAPKSGIATNISVHPGENVIAGASLFSLIDDSEFWLEANFKETDLTNVKTGQPALVTVDAFPGKQWQARVASITPATGSEFSLLPAQNSTGNWVKVVQRIMVRIEFDSPDLQAQLSSGMSAVVEVDTGHKRHLPWLAGN